jgi:hypothetical protein
MVKTANLKRKPQVKSCALAEPIMQRQSKVAQLVGYRETQNSAIAGIQGKSAH